MIGLLQRVSAAKVDVDGGTIGNGLLVLVCAEPGDTEAEADRLLERLLVLRVFADQAGRMNLSLTEIGGGLLLVPQFTLATDTRCGTRPGFSRAAEPTLARRLFGHLVGAAGQRHAPVAAGRFGADMQVGPSVPPGSAAWRGGSGFGIGISRENKSGCHRIWRPCWHCRRARSPGPGTASWSCYIPSTAGVLPQH